jgi:DNA-binding XRE family transcriptional regulator
VRHVAARIVDGVRVRLRQGAEGDQVLFPDLDPSLLRQLVDRRLGKAAAGLRSSGREAPGPVVRALGHQHTSIPIEQRNHRARHQDQIAADGLSAEVRKRPGAAEEIDAHKRAIVAAVRLNELRKQRGQTQAQLADLLGMTQANVSRIERSDNLYLSTLADYVDGLGGHIEINAVFDDDVVSLGPVEKDPSELPA